MANFTEREAAEAIGVPEAVLIRWRELGVGPAGVPGSKGYRRPDLESYLLGLVAMLNQGHGDPDVLAQLAEVRTRPADAILNIEDVARIFKCSARHIENGLEKVASIPAAFTYTSEALVEFLERQFCSEARKRLAELRANGVLPEPGADNRPDPKPRKSRLYEGMTA